MSKPRVVVEVDGGVVSAVFGDPAGPAIEVIIVDWDNIKEGGKPYVPAHGAFSEMSLETHEQVDCILMPGDSGDDVTSGIPDGPEFKSYRFFEDRGLTTKNLLLFEESTNSEDFCWVVNAPCMTGVALFSVIHGLSVSPSGIRQRPNKWYAGNAGEGEGVDAVVDAEGKVLWVHESREARIMGESSAIVPPTSGT